MLVQNFWAFYKACMPKQLTRTLTRLFEVKNLILLHTVGDGNCYFRSIAAALNNYEVDGRNNWSHLELRKLAVQYIRANEDVYRATIVGRGLVFNDYMDRMLRDGEWAEYEIVEALPRLFGENLRVHVMDNDNNLINFALTYNINNARYINVYYNGSNHFCGVLPKPPM